MPHHGVPLAAAALALLALAAAPASAYPGERPAPDLEPYVRAAAGAWASRGVTGCPAGISVAWAADLADADAVTALGRGRDCRVVVRDEPVFADGTRQPGGWCPPRIIPLIEHEVGHALGLKHEATPFPIMQSGPLSYRACGSRGWTVPRAPAETILREPCPVGGSEVVGCADDRTAWVGRDPSRFTVEHERGHLADAQVLTDPDRRALRPLLGLRPGPRWGEGAAESFADAYATCVLGFGASWQATSGYWPSRAQHARACAFLWWLAQAQRAGLR
jgi:hypothetical protein